MAENNVPETLPADFFDHEDDGMNLGGLKFPQKTCDCKHYEPRSTKGIKDDSCKHCGGLPPSADRRYRKAL